MSVRVAASAGFCFGVDRAVGLVEKTVREGKRAVTLGPIIHNHHVVQHFAALGVREIASPEEVPGGSAVIIRSHGVSRAVYEALQARGLEIIDATCPFVSRIHRIVQEAEANGRQPLIIGTPEHPEVVASQAGAGIRSSSRTAKPCRNGSMTTQNDTICHLPWSHRPQVRSFYGIPARKSQKKCVQILSFLIQYAKRPKIDRQKPLRWLRSATP